MGCLWIQHGIQPIAKPYYSKRKPITLSVESVLLLFHITHHIPSRQSLFVRWMEGMHHIMPPYRLLALE